MITTTYPVTTPYVGAGVTAADLRPAHVACTRLRTVTAPVMDVRQEKSVPAQAWPVAVQQTSDHGKFAFPRISTTRTAALTNDRDDAALMGADVTEVPGIRSCRIPV